MLPVLCCSCSTWAFTRHGAGSYDFDEDPPCVCVYADGHRACADATIAQTTDTLACIGCVFLHRHAVSLAELKFPAGATKSEPPRLLYITCWDTCFNEISPDGADQHVRRLAAGDDCAEAVWHHVGRIKISPYPSRVPTMHDVVSLYFELTVSKTAPMQILGIQPWPRPRFNPSVAALWVASCICDTAPDSSSSLPASFRVIDLDELRLTSLPAGSTYWALSYMWEPPVMNGTVVRTEKANYAASCQPGGIKPEKMTGLLRDVMSFCRDLGVRYIWIDRFCIIQDDKADQGAQIMAMNTIYSHASCTLVCALNKKDIAGLPGYKSLPRTPRGSENALKPPPDLSCSVDDGIRATLWDTRGWTFQERFLSRRSLVVSNDQIMFQCGCGESTEYQVAATGKLWADKSTSYRASKDSLNQQKVGGGCSRDEIEHYQSMVHAYACRDLGYASDNLNAFQGLANDMSLCFQTNFLNGIPEAALSLGLCWRRSQPLAAEAQDIHTYRCGDLPTWTWARDRQYTEMAIFRSPYELPELAMFYQDSQRGLRGVGTTPTNFASSFPRSARDIMSANAGALMFRAQYCMQTVRFCDDESGSSSREAGIMDGFTFYFPDSTADIRLKGDRIGFVVFFPEESVCSRYGVAVQVVDRLGENDHSVLICKRLGLISSVSPTIKPRAGADEPFEAIVCVLL